jgi:hypothetical protein
MLLLDQHPARVDLWIVDDRLEKGLSGNFGRLAPTSALTAAIQFALTDACSLRRYLGSAPRERPN